MKKALKKVLAIILSLGILATFCTVPMTASADGNPLKFGSDAKFKIVIFSDIQENTSDTAGIERLTGIMEQAIGYENPDLIVLLGDNTELNIKNPEDDFRQLLTQILAPIDDAGVPYAFVFGNHDNQSYYSGQRTDKEAMLAVYQSIGDCRTVDADPTLAGTGTCKIPIYASGSNSVAFDLFMVDSNTYQNPITGAGGYDNPHADQLAWIAANKDAGVNSLVFQHIPMPENYNLLVEDENGEKTYGGKKYAKALNANATGYLGEFPCPPYAENNTGEFAALKAMGGVLGVFTGHDHKNDYTGTYDGINLTAVPGMTYFNYGDEAVRGYGVIELDEGDLSTYDYHTVKFSQMSAIASPYALNVDFSGGNAIETSGNATAITGNGSTVTYGFDSTLNKTVATFDGTSGYGYTLSDIALDKMSDGYTYEILYKLPSAPAAETDLASGMYDNAGFGTEFKSGTEFRYWQSFDESQQYRKLYYGADSYQTGTWLHIVAVWDPTLRSGSGQLRGFLNGVYKDYSNPGSNVLKFDANGEFYIGGNSNSSGNFRDGTACDIAFVRIHDKAYSDSEVADLYTAAITPGSGAVDGKYYPYDVITYSDLEKDHLPLDENGFTFGGGNLLTYNATSLSYSAKLKFRWTVGTDTGIQFSFDRSGSSGTSMSYPFGVWVKRPNNNSAGPNGAWHLKPTSGSLLVDMDSLPQEGDTFDIEFGRLKVMQNASSHAGEYYVYLKVDGVLIQETYSTADAYGNYTSSSNACHLSNEIVFDDWSSYGNKISASPTVESYDSYDEIEYADFLDTGNNHLTSSGVTLTAQNNLFHYDATSESHSVIYKFRYVAGATVYFQMFPGVYRNGDPFAYRINNATTWEKRYGTGVGSVSVDTITEGTEIDIELARLKVVSGDNIGKYYTYLKANDTVLFEAYVSSDEIGSTDLNDSIQLNLNGSNSCMIKPIPTEQEDPDALYYYYDEIDYNDLLENGNHLASETQMGSKTFTYNRTANTYSAILRYRWRAANMSTQFQLSFDKAGSGIDYMFGVQLYKPGSEGRTNSSIRLRPGRDDANAWVELASNIEDGREYDVEFARLKVKNGENAGKYYVYFKLDGELISESYVAADVVDGNGNYTSNPGNASCHLSNEIYLTFWGGGSADRIMHTPVPDTYDDYDEVTYYDFIKDGTSLYSTNPNEYSINSKKFTYNKTSESGSAVIKYRWKGANTGSSFYISFDPPPKTSDPSQSAAEYTFGLMYSGSASTAWLRIGDGSAKPISPALVTGNNYDIEFARLKIVSGDNAGKYKLYFKITEAATGNEAYYEEKYIPANVVDSNGQYVSNTDGAGNGVTCTISNSFYITFWGGSGNKIAPIPVPETYYDYDEVTYDDLLINGNPVESSGMNLSEARRCTYNATSETYSAVLKFRWTAGEDPHVVIYFDEWSGNAYPFCLAIKRPNYSGLGAAAGANGAWHLDPSVASHIVQMSEPIVAGNNYDIEYGRLKVKTGPNADKYYVYLMVNEELVSSYYYDGVSSDGTYKNGAGTLSNNVLFTSSTADNFICETPVPYEPYDEIGYEDLLLGGNTLSADETSLSGATVFTYNRTSPTGSAIFKYRWKIGSASKFQLSFEKTASTAMAYMFGAWLSAPGEEAGYSNGRMWLRPGTGPEVNMPAVLTPGSEHNVEFARLKVSTGPNRGKYYVYIKIDNVLIAEDYVEKSVVGSDGSYTSNPGSTACNVKSGEIFFAFWGSDGNSISTYRRSKRGDFDSNNVVNARDLETLRDIILGSIGVGNNPEEVADFDSNGIINVIDLVALKKYVAPVNTYSKSGSLTLGMQEHLLESNGSFVDNTKTASYIASASATLGAKSYRLSMAIHDLYYASSVNGVIARNNGKMAQLKGMVAALKAQGINEILYVTDSFILPYNYADPATNHNKTCPTPGTQDYENWLKVNSAAFAALAAEIPEIKYFEPFNEINLTTTGFEKPGIPWDASEQVAAGYKYTVQEKAGIMADLCWYISRAVKSVDPSNQVTTPSICVGSHESIIEGTYLNALYNAIESGTYPTNNAVSDVRADNYFTIVNIHAYPEYATTNSALNTKVNNIATDIGNSIYSVMQAHRDGGSRVWLTETGASVFGSRTESNAGSLVSKLLTKINTNMTYIDTVIFYKVADASASNGFSEPETKFGLFYAGDASSNRYAAKQTAKTIYSFFHNGSTDYSAINTLVNNARNGAYSS